MHKIGTALLSFGMSGRVFHAPFIQQHAGFEFLGSWERSKKNLHQLYPKAFSYPTLESVLQDDAVELIVVNTPTNTHYQLAKQALEATKHVIVEKAFTTTVAEAKELKKLAAQKKRMLSIFQNRRWDSDFRTVDSVLRSGVLGRPVEVSLSYDRYNPALSPKAHKETPGPGAGIVYDLAPHLIDQALKLFGNPSAVFASLASRRSNSKVDDYFEILLYYPEFHVRLRASYFVREPVPSYIIHGTQGSFLKSRADVQEAVLQAGQIPGDIDWGKERETDYGLLHTEVDGKLVRKTIPSIPGNYMEYYDGIYNSIAEHQQPPITSDDGINVMRVIEAVLESNLKRQIVDF